ncbi:MAG: radical SAM protein [Polyangiaceae bacterium]|nr:radical SAM protein [Polyangiaceae bacterium]
MSAMQPHAELILDGTKLGWHLERVRAWERGERVAPITVDMALTRACNYACHFCYAMLQENERHQMTGPVVEAFLTDAAAIGVRGVSLVSDGESTLSPVFVDAVVRGSELGLSMACGTNGLVLTPSKLERVLPHLTYLRVNISAGEPERYAQIMGVKAEWFERVCDNIRHMVRIKQERGLGVTIGLQMVLMPDYADQVLPLARLGQQLRPDYLVIKHCSDDEDGRLGVDYGAYEKLSGLLRQAESLSDGEYRVIVKWSKIEAGTRRSYQRCYGPPFLLQISGSGLVAPCGMLFNERYEKLHIGNICEQRFAEIFASERYWQVMRHLASSRFNAQKMCGSLCLQHKVNEALDAHRKGRLPLAEPVGPAPAHLDFV